MFAALGFCSPESTCAEDIFVVSSLHRTFQLEVSQNYKIPEDGGALGEEKLEKEGTVGYGESATMAKPCVWGRAGTETSCGGAASLKLFQRILGNDSTVPLGTLHQ